jgi:hypothetical protein
MIAYGVSIKYMITGYAVILIVFTIYLVSLFMRWRKLKGQLKVLEELKNRQ